MPHSQRKKDKEENPRTSARSKKKQANDSSKVLKYSGLAFQMGILITIGILAGGYLDGLLGLEKPYLTAALAFLGLAMAFYMVLKDLSNDAK